MWGQIKHPWFTPYGAIPYLLGNEVGYLSFLSALHRHDLISQIPITIQIATSGHGRKLKTNFGTYEFIKIQPKMMQEGVVWAESRLPYRIATPEKATLPAWKNELKLLNNCVCEIHRACRTLKIFRQRLPFFENIEQSFSQTFGVVEQSEMFEHHNA